MKAAVVDAIGSAPVTMQRPEPRLDGDDDVLVRLGAAALNPIDLLIASGEHPLGSPRLPYVPGSEGVGTVIDGSALAPGTRVRVQVPAGFVDGTLAEMVRAPADACVELPAALSDETAAAIGLVGVSAHLGLQRAGLATGESVLVLGATGALGQAVIRAARSLGAERIVAAGRDEERLTTLAGIDGRVDLWQGAVRAQLDAHGGPVDLVADLLWGPYAGTAMDCLAPGGRYLSLGSAAGSLSEIDSHRLRARSASIIGFSGAATQPHEVASAYRAVAQLATEGRFEIAIERHRLADAARAWGRQADSPGAKVVILP
jgi:NADPH:quinone reductase-like Zn-dependent oxidoreductase